MSYSKRQFVIAAFDKVGLADYEFDLEPQLLQSALRDLDNMIAAWGGDGIYIGYPLPSEPEYSNIDEETNVPDWVNEGIIANLAIRIATGLGKTLHPKIETIAKSAYETIVNRTQPIPEKQLPGTMPLGAGNKPWRWSYHNYVIPPRKRII